MELKMFLSYSLHIPEIYLLLSGLLLDTPLSKPPDETQVSHCTDTVKHGERFVAAETVDWTKRKGRNFTHEQALGREPSQKRQQKEGTAAFNGGTFLQLLRAASPHRAQQTRPRLSPVQPLSWESDLCGSSALGRDSIPILYTITCMQ